MKEVFKMTNLIKHVVLWAVAGTAMAFGMQLGEDIYDVVSDKYDAYKDKKAEEAKVKEESEVKEYVNL